MFARLVHTCAACAVVGVGAAAWAADPPPEVLDTGVSDRHGAAHQMRVMPVDLSPHGFNFTYRVPGRSDLLMRSNGAVYAVFDNMEYERDKRYKYHKVFKSVVPAATVFYIGRPNFDEIRSTGIRMVDLRRNKAPVETPASTALDSVHGVDHVRPESLGPIFSGGARERMNLRMTGAHPNDIQHISEDISYPVTPPRRAPAKAAGEGAPADDRAVGDASPRSDDASPARATPGATPGATPDAPAGAATPARPARTNLNERIDDLVRRASKDC